MSSYVMQLNGQPVSKPAYTSATTALFDALGPNVGTLSSVEPIWNPVWCNVLKLTQLELNELPANTVSWLHNKLPAVQSIPIENSIVALTEAVPGVIAGTTAVIELQPGEADFVPLHTLFTEQQFGGGAYSLIQPACGNHRVVHATFSCSIGVLPPPIWVSAQASPPSGGMRQVTVSGR